jgi:hypothetical protein
MKNKLFLLMAIILALPLASASQDIIYRNDGEEIRAVILDISPGVIKYLKYDHRQGPVFSIARTQVQKIVYENGRIVTFDKPVKEIKPETENSYQPARKPPLFGWHIGLGASNLYGDIENNKPLLASAIGASVTLPFGRNNSLLLQADLLSLGCSFHDMDYLDESDSSRVSITNAVEDLGYIGLTIMNRYFLNPDFNYYVEGGVYGSFLINARMQGDVEVTDTTGQLSSGSFNEQLIEFYNVFDFGIAAGLGGRIPLNKTKKWHLTLGMRFYYGLTNIIDTGIPRLNEYRESNIYGLVFLGLDIPTKSPD